ncbi:DinB family protein [Dyadobacter sp. 676]|uniref:DinB family protein n=1 Tax=Dyadobacter sp. 676 TaxID=3088362 RepID=A0AAU8FP95_9BACT
MNFQIGSLLSYNIWANRRLTEQIKDLTREEFTGEIGGSFPSVRLTLVHLLEADWLWLNRWQGKPLVLPPDTWDTGSAESVSEIWLGIQEEILRVFESKAEETMLQPLHFITRAGAALEMPYWQTVSHMVNHGTYHRGQLANMIRILGYKPVGTDLFLFFNEENSKANGTAV